MNVCTDNPRFAEEWFTPPSEWKSGLSDRFPEEFHPVIGKLLDRDRAASTSGYYPKPWRYALLVEHAPESQFDILVGAMRAGIELPHGLICLAGSGDGFHGQRKREWAALPGNIHLSLFLSPNRSLSEIGAGLSLLPAVSLVQTLDCIAGLDARPGIRWVNDILLGGSKVAGFLVHTRTSGGQVTGAIFGIGINVNTVPPVAPTMFVPSVTALCKHVPDPRACILPAIARSLLDRFARNYEKLLDGKLNELLDFYRRRSVVLGRRVRVYADAQGDERTQLAEGTVQSIGDRLELNFTGGHRPVTQGRLVLDAAPARTPTDIS